MHNIKNNYYLLTWDCLSPGFSLMLAVEIIREIRISTGSEPSAGGWLSLYETGW